MSTTLIKGGTAVTASGTLAADVLVAGTASFAGGPADYAGNIRRLRPVP